MNNASLELGGTNWAEKDGNILGYSVGDTSGKYSPQEFTFARGSNLSATRIDRAGLIVKGRENVLLQSNQFDTTWTKTNSSVTSGQSGYDGSSDAWLLNVTAGTGDQNIKQAIVSSGINTFSVYLKAGTTDWVALRVTGSPSGIVWFNLANGTKGSNPDSVPSYTITSVGSGWYRCTLTIKSTIDTVYIYPATGDSFAGLNCTSGDNIYIQDAQLEQGLAASPYIPTTTTSAQAGVLENTPRLNYTTGVANPYLLLEPSRTNVIPQSEYYNTFWNINDVTIEDNSAVSPEGLQNASKLSELATNARHRLGVGAVTSATTGVHTASVFMKKGTARYGFVHIGVSSNAYTIVVDLEDGTITDTTTNGTITYQNVEDYGNGWYRCSVGGSVNAFTGAYVMQFGTAGSAEPTYFNYVPKFLGSTSNNIYTYGATLELGSYPTSYIPTYSVSATRAQDTCNKTNASGEINSTEGVLYAEIAALANDLTQRAISLSDGSNTNRVCLLYNDSSNSIRLFIQVGGSTQSSIISTSYTITDSNKIAVKWKENDFSLWINGVEVGTDNSGVSFTSNTLNTLDFNFPNDTTFFYGKVNEVQVYKEALTDAQLATLTTI